LYLRVLSSGRLDTRCDVFGIAEVEYSQEWSRKEQIMKSTERELLKRIAVNPEIFAGKPIIRDMRISVELILSLLAQGETPEAILADYPDLEPEDIRACF
jgi:uncharacterized protein (DUF433 family)